MFIIKEDTKSPEADHLSLKLFSAQFYLHGNNFSELPVFSNNTRHLKWLLPVVTTTQTGRNNHYE